MNEEGNLTIQKAHEIINENYQKEDDELLITGYMRQEVANLNQLFTVSFIKQLYPSDWHSIGLSISKITINGLINEIESEYQMINERIEAVENELAKAKPVLKAVETMINGMKNRRLNEIKALRNPPKLMMLIFEAVAITFGKKIKTRNDIERLKLKHKQRSKSLTDGYLRNISIISSHDLFNLIFNYYFVESPYRNPWRKLQNMVLSHNFKRELLNFNANKMKTKTRKKIKAIYLNHEEWCFEKANKMSKICGPLLMWVQEQVKYADLLDSVEPMTKEIKELKKQFVAKGSETKLKQYRNVLQFLEGINCVNIAQNELFTYDIKRICVLYYGSMVSIVARNVKHLINKIQNEIDLEMEQINDRIKAVENGLTEVKSALETAEKYVSGIHKKQLDNLKAIGRPSMITDLVLKSVALILNIKIKNKQDIKKLELKEKKKGRLIVDGYMRMRGENFNGFVDSNGLLYDDLIGLIFNYYFVKSRYYWGWKDIQRMVGGNNFISLILKFDTNKITPKMRAKLQEDFLCDEHFSYDRINYAHNPVAAPLILWVNAQVKYSQLLDSVETMNGEVNELKEKLDTKRKKTNKYRNVLQELLGMASWETKSVSC
eukprot:330736_1